MSKYQMFSARYQWTEPMSESEASNPLAAATAYYLLLETGQKVFMLKEMVGWVLARGGKVVARVVPSDYVSAKAKMAITLKEAIGQVPDFGTSWVSESSGSAVVETPSALGPGEHMRRRAIVESFLKAVGVAFTLECATLHSDGACKPVPEKLLAEASAQVGGN